MVNNRTRIAAKTVASKHSREIPSILTFLIVAAFPVGALAAESTAPAKEKTQSQITDVVSLPEITVTGQSFNSETDGTGSYTTQQTSAGTGLPLAPREIPQSVTVITRQRMDDQQLDTVGSVLQNATGISGTTTHPNFFKYYARGFAVDNLQYDGVPTTQDGGLRPGENFQESAFYDRVEVVRGATGLLQGVGEPSASINLIRKRPLRDLALQGSLSAGSWDNYRSMLDVSTPLTADGRIRARVVGAYTNRNSFRDYEQLENKSLYGVLDIDLTSSTTLTLGHEYQGINLEGSNWYGLPLFFSDGSRTDWSRSKSTAARWSGWDSRGNTSFARLEQRFDNGWKLYANGSHTKAEMTAHGLSSGYLSNIDRLTGDGLVPWGLDGGSRSQQNSVDVMATGPFELLGRQHELVIGGSGSKMKSDSYFLNKMSGFPPTNAYNWDGEYPKWPYAARPTTSRTITQSGFYGAARFSLADPLKVIVGARLSNYKFDESTGNHYKTTSEVSPYFGAVYDLNDTYSVYASYTKIFKPQTSNRDINNNTLTPAKGDNKEVGIKGEFLAGRLNASVSVFEAQLDGLAQIDSGSMTPDGTQAYKTVDGTKSRGIDLDIQGELSRGWNLYVGISHFTASDQDGNRLNTNIPRTTARLFTTYQLPGDWNKLTIGGGVNWQSRFYETATNPKYGTVEVGQKSYAVASLMARYEISNDVTISANLNNLFDRKYYASAGFNNSFIYGEPRSFTLSLTYRMN